MHKQRGYHNAGSSGPRVCASSGACVSPTDPKRIMFCHEGPWHYNDRIWTIRADGTGLKKIHTRTMDMEIAGHEFFGADGRTIWYDLQTPRSRVFWLAGYKPPDR